MIGLRPASSYKKCRLIEKNTTKMSFIWGISTRLLSQLFEITTYVFLAWVLPIEE